MLALIYNPNSGGFHAAALLKMENELKKRRIPYRLYKTERAGHAKKLAARAVADGADTVACYGGDGTAFEVINGIPDPSSVDLLLIPSGTGNDMLRCLNVPKDAMKALILQLDSPLKQMDLVCVNDSRFLNVAGMGLDVQVLREYAQMRNKGFGSLAYKISIFRAMRSFRPMHLTLSVDGGAPEATDCSMLSIGNGRYIGGGMCCLPSADPFDGLLDLMIVSPVSNWMIALAFPLFYFGKHTGLKIVKKLARVHTLDIYSDQPLWLQMDGELAEMPEIHFKVMPKAVNLHLPSSAR